ncbi:MAG: ATP-binding protein [Candidatus Cloacimonetes bacterium 4572_65]|nr:MAG: ATP-binding protein [Candidatus Cloacimonetes bacterium 4572_65]
MAEYWNKLPEYEDRINDFYDKKPEAVVTLEYNVKKHDFINSGNGSAELKRLLKKLGINPVILRQIAVASYEAEINLAAHSNGGVMNSFVHKDLVRIVFEDIGPGISDINKALEPGFSTAVEYVREMGFGAGLGLPNIKKNTHSMRLDSVIGRNTVLEIVIFF